jgi:hypothetical protein
VRSVWNETADSLRRRVFAAGLLGVHTFYVAARYGEVLARADVRPLTMDSGFDPILGSGVCMTAVEDGKGRPSIIPAD